MTDALFAAGAASRVVACRMPKSRAAMHLDTFFSFYDRDIVTSFVELAEQITCYSLYPRDRGGVDVRLEDRPLFKVVAGCLGLRRLHVIPTGVDSCEQAREQWDDGNNVVAIEPGAVPALRPQHPYQHRTEEGRNRGDDHPLRRAGPRPRRGDCMTCPLLRVP